jgi:putative solute:sodium symporter small subunit
MAQDKSEAHWLATKSLMWTCIGIWAFFGFLIHTVAKLLNGIVILGFPMGFYMAAQGSLIAFVILLFWFARKQEDIDRQFGFAEDE